MSWVEKITNIATGGLAKEVTDLVKAYWPPDMPPEKIREFELRADALENERRHQSEMAGLQQEQEFNKRITDLEGTAADLKTIPIVGALIIFLRGMQRPVWGFATLWIDYKSFSQAWKLTDQQDACLVLINVLVLGFLFGERAIQNVMPYFSQYISQKNKGG